MYLSPTLSNSDLSVSIAPGVIQIDLHAVLGGGVTHEGDAGGGGGGGVRRRKLLVHAGPSRLFLNLAQALV